MGIMEKKLETARVTQGHIGEVWNLGFGVWSPHRALAGVGRAHPSRSHRCIAVDSQPTP